MISIAKERAAPGQDDASTDSLQMPVRTTPTALSRQVHEQLDCIRHQLASLLMPNALLPERMTTDECLGEVMESFPSRLMTHAGFPWPHREYTLTTVRDVI